MEYTYTKERNFLNFYANGDTANPYRFDINTGIFTGKMGKAIVNYPKGFSTWIRDFYNDGQNKNNVLFMLAHTLYYNSNWVWSLHDITVSQKASALANYSNYFLVADKLQSIGYFLTYRDLNKEALLFVGENFKAFSRIYATNHDLTLTSFKEKYQYEVFCEKYGKVFSLYNFEEDVIKLIFKASNEHNFSEKEIVLMSNYLNRGLWEFFECEGMATDYNVNRNRNALINKIATYFKMCKALEIQPEKDFLKSFVAVYKNYVIHQKELDIKRLKIHTDKMDRVFRDFQNDKYMVVIPTTEQMFFDEAQQQSNCVYSSYFDRVLNGTSNIIFIREKDKPNKSLITCEISYLGTIVQYKLAYNCDPHAGTEEYDLKLQLADYLKLHWGV